MSGIVQHLYQCLPLAPRGIAVLLKNTEPQGTKCPSASAAIRVHQWEPSSMQWTSMASVRTLKLCEPVCLLLFCGAQIFDCVLERTDASLIILQPDILDIVDFEDSVGL